MLSAPLDSRAVPSDRSQEVRTKYRFSLFARAPHAAAINRDENNHGDTEITEKLLRAVSPLVYRVEHRFSGAVKIRK